MSGQYEAAIRIDESILNAYNMQNTIRSAMITDQLQRMAKDREIAFEAARLRREAQLSRVRRRNKQAVSRITGQSQIAGSSSASDSVKAAMDEITALRNATNRDIEEMGTLLTARIENNEIRMEQFEEVTNAILSEQADLAKGQAELSLKLNEITAKEEDKAALSQEIIRQVNISIAEIEMLDYDFFARGELDDIKKMSGFVHANHSSTRYDPAIAQGQGVIVDSESLRRKIVKKQSEWEGLFAAINQDASELIVEVSEEENRYYELETTEGTEVKPAHIDIFSGGKLSNIRKQLDIIIEKIKLFTETEDYRKLGDIGVLIALSGELKDAKEELEHTKVVAKNNYIRACGREELLNEISWVLGEKFGMNFVEAEYFNGQGDLANDAIHANFVEPMSRDRITLIIRPVFDNKDGVSSTVIGETLELDIVEAGDETRVNIDARSHEIMSAIGKETPGIQILNATCREETRGIVSQRRNIGDMKKVRNGERLS